MKLISLLTEHFLFCSSCPASSKLQVQLGDHVVVKGERTGRIRYIGHLDKIGQPNLVFVGLELDAPGKPSLSTVLVHHHHHHHHQSLNREGRWGTTDDFATSFLHFPLFSTALCTVLVKHLSPDPAVFPWCNAALGEAQLINVTKHRPYSRKENLLSLFTGLGKGYCCRLLPQIWPGGKVLSSQIAFCAHSRRIANVSVAWRHSWWLRPHFTDWKFI